MRKFRGPLEMFLLWVPDRGLAHTLSELMRGPRLGDAVIAVLVLDSELVNRSTRANRCTFPTAAEISSPPTQLITVTFRENIERVRESVGKFPSAPLQPRKPAPERQKNTNPQK
jgi:hypothetical protein